MFQNYFKIAWRNLKKYRFYAAINVLGLFTGIVFTLLIGVYVWGELQVNRRLRNSERQCILLSDWKIPNKGVDFATIGPLAKRLKEDYPTLVANYYRFDGISSIISKGEKRFREGIQLGDKSLLVMFGFKMLYGNKKTALSNPYSVVITANKALKYFGKKNVVGETITIQNFKGEERAFIISGVFEDLSVNSVTHLNNKNSPNTTLRPEIFTSQDMCAFFGRVDFDSWNNFYIPSYIELKEGVAVDDLKEPINNLMKLYASKAIQKDLSVTPTLLADFYFEKDNGLVKKMVYTLSTIGLFILLMAIINFINISVSMSGSRMKEIGVRKVLGGKQSQFISQFLIESFILVLVATILALVAFSSIKPVLSQIVGTEMPKLTTFPLYMIFVLVGFVCVVGLLAGLYPAFVLSSLKAVASLKGKLEIKNVSFQKSLVGFQFSVALLILISAFIITQQVDYFFNKDLGYNKDYVLSAQVPRDWTDKGVKKMETIRAEFEKLPEINKASVSFEIPNGNNGNFFPIHRVGSASNESISMLSLSVDEHYFDTYQIHIEESLHWADEDKKEGPIIVVNETAARALGWDNPMDALGEKIKIKGGVFDYTIRGIAKDFHFGSMTQQIQPLAFFNLNIFLTYRYLNFKVKPGDMQSTISNIQKKWSQLIPESPFDYHFMDDSLKELYTSEIKFRKAVYNASLLSLAIVLLGIVGLVSLSAHKRIKEVGIRKVLGASTFKIILLFIKEFTIIIVIASAIAIPIAYYVMNEWLNNYVYRISMSAQPFFGSILALMIVAFLFIGLMSFKTANTNPIKSLKTE
ncbi:ABC transporter permease [Snuella lapsa]|uniref:ABC transporter permease n=1 Tax=Snuella lapsa TaxID=870481 RepID=A0ABP6WU06_9FLAO